MVLVGYAYDVAMMAVAATIEELNWKCNESLEIVSQRMKEHILSMFASGERRQKQGM